MKIFAVRHQPLTVTAHSAESGVSYEAASGDTWRPNFDGARAEVGGGIVWQLNADHQLSLDYEASFGDKYDKPWGLTAGYRCLF